MVENLQVHGLAVVGAESRVDNDAASVLHGNGAIKIGEDFDGGGDMGRHF